MVTSDGKLCVCNEICENMAKFKKIYSKKVARGSLFEKSFNENFIDSLKFYQSTLSSGPTLVITGDKKKEDGTIEKAKSKRTKPHFP